MGLYTSTIFMGMRMDNGMSMSSSRFDMECRGVRTYRVIQLYTMVIFMGDFLLYTQISIMLMNVH